MSDCFSKKTLQIATAISSLFIVGSVQATNGYFAHGYGTKSKGLAGAGAAWAQDSMAAATNPAGMARVGSRVDFGAAQFHPDRSVKVSGNPTNPPPDQDGNTLPDTFPLRPGRYKSASKDFLVPHFGYNKMLNPDMSVGVSVYGNGGMNSNYDTFENAAFCTSGFLSGPNAGQTFPVGTQTGLFCNGKSGISLSQLFIAPTFAMNSGNLSWGVSPILAYQVFEAKGIGAFAQFSASPQDLSRNGKSTSTGAGIKIGGIFDVSPSFTVGASYQSKMAMSEFDEYKGLFAEEGDFDIPSTWTVGLNYKVNDSHRVVLDVQQINYSDVASISNPIGNLFNPGCQPQPFDPAGPNGAGPGCFGASSGAGFGWDDMTVIKLGWEFSVASVEDVIWRLGFSHADQPIPDDQVTLNTFAPAVVEDHFTFGFTKAHGNHELTFAGMVAFKNSVEGSHTFDPSQTVEIEMEQFELEASYAIKF